MPKGSPSLSSVLPRGPTTPTAGDCGSSSWLTYDVNDGDLKAVMRLTLMEMLQVFSQLENHVSAEKAWALELMRDVGFTVEPALGSPDGARHRVWIDADAAGAVSAA